MSHALETILAAVEAAVRTGLASSQTPVWRDRDIAFDIEGDSDLPAVDIRLGAGAEEEEASLRRRRVTSTVFVDHYAHPADHEVSKVLLDMYRQTYVVMMRPPAEWALGRLLIRIRPAGHDPIVTMAEGQRPVAYFRTSYSVTWETDFTSATEVT